MREYLDLVDLQIGLWMIVQIKLINIARLSPSQVIPFPSQEVLHCKSGETGYKSGKKYAGMNEYLSDYDRECEVTVAV